MPAARIVIRCDGSAAIGAGHVTRCLALAWAMRDRELEPIFTTTAGTAGLATVQAAGFDVRPVPARRTEDDLDERDLEATVRVARETDAGCVLVDHYGAPTWYLEALRDASLAIAVIDDTAERDLRAADWVLNQNISAPALAHRVRDGASLLLGSSYALLRAEFATARAALSREYSAGARRVLVTFGGGDTAELCSAALRALEPVSRRLEIRCVITDAVLPEELRQRARDSRHDVRILRGAADMADQMTWADVSLNAGGSTCWELLCLGVPMVVLALSSDQRRNPRALEQAGVARSAVSLEAAASTIEGLLADPRTREEMSRRGQALVDGAGAARAAASLAGLVRAPAAEAIHGRD